MNVLQKLFIALLFVVMTGGCAATGDTQQAASSEATVDKSKWYPNIVDVNFVKKYAGVPRKDGVMIIDARPKARKFDKGHIPGAYSIPERKFDKMTDMLPKDKSTLLIFYCGGTKCMLSHKSAFKAEKLGYTNIKVYATGFPKWKKSGNVVSVSISHLQKLIAKNAPMVIIDSRPKKRKFDKGHIPGAISIPDRSFDKMTAKLPGDKKTPLYFYCGGYKCKLSPNSAAKAMKLGYKKVYIVPEGYPGWKKTNKGAAAPKIVAGKESGSIALASFNEIMNTAPNSIMLVDVRDADEYKRATMRGAVNIPINELEKKIDTLPKNKTIVFFCGTAGRAGEAYDMVKMFNPGIKAYFLNAEIDFNKDGSYSMKDLS
jgi:rhodanese-related sulfurtransferase